MGGMIAIRDLLTGDQYESMRFASQMTGISVERLKKNMISDKVLKHKGKVYLFREILYGDKSTKRGKIKKDKMPFGKYKGQLILTIKDKPYLIWVLNNTNIDSRCKYKIKKRISEL